MRYQFMAGKKILLINSIVFLAAFLLFQIELIAAKMFLPKFGGSYLVWGSCVAFFQGALLFGYLHSHLVIKRLGIFKYRRFHLLLVLLPLVFFPGRPMVLINSSQNIPLVMNIFWQLLLSIGPVFFVLSTTSIIFQAWLSESEFPESRNPYVLYAVSNLGSFAALLSYPLFFEQAFGLDTQLLIWRTAYFIFIVLHLFALKFIKVKEENIINEESPRPVIAKDIVTWLLFSAAGVIMFLSVTNIITYEITPIPLLWVIPLSIYLLSFVLCFKKNPWCPAWIKEKIHIITAFGILLFFLSMRSTLPFIIEVAVYLTFLFIVCMFCSNELSLRRPQDAGSLTTFYLAVSAGGFIGGIFIAWIIPIVSTSMVEYLVGLLAMFLALSIGERSKNYDIYGIRLIFYSLCLIIIWPTIFRTYNILGMIILFSLFGVIYAELNKNRQMLALSIFAFICISPSVEPLWEAHKYVYKHRNYYGIYKIYDEAERRFLVNGTTLHGAQYIPRARKNEAITYYHIKTPVGRLMTSGAFEFSRVGVIGLGTGNLAAYNDKSKVMDFFELDYDVYKIAKGYFSYLDQSKGKVNFIFGDARLALGKVPPKRYDLLIVDAFSSDSVPVHLLTLEAIAKYKECIKDDGIILFHISNRYIDLLPVLISNARALNAHVCSISNPVAAGDDCMASQWAAFSWDVKSFKKLTSQLNWEDCGAKTIRGKAFAWTDQYSNLIKLIKINTLLLGIRDFQPFYWSDDSAIDIIKLIRHYSAQGSEYFSKKDYTNSIIYNQKAIELEPYNDNLYFYVGKAYANLNNYSAAIRYYNRAIDLNKNNYSAYFYLGKANASLNRYKEAVENYKKALDISADNANAYYNLSLAYLGLGLYGQMIHSMQKAVELSPEAYYQEILYRRLLVDFKPVSYYQEAIAANSNSDSLYYEFGSSLLNLNQYDEAAKHYKKAIEINPENAKALDSLGILYIVIGRYQEALGCFIDARGLYGKKNDGQSIQRIDKLIEILSTGSGK